MPDLVEDFFSNPAGRLGTVRCLPWHYRDRALIVGDAAHAIVPFHGQGMNAAFEDCSVLENLLDRYSDDWEQVNPQFSRLRKPDADAIADMAIENYITMRSTVNDPKYSLKKEVGFELERRLPELFVPRYSMVMFHTMPYSEAQTKGAIQAEILDMIVANADGVDDVNWDHAEKLVRERLS